MFEVPRAAAARFMAAVKRTATGEEGEGGVRIEPVEGKPRDAARANKRAGAPPPQKRYKAKPAYPARAKRGP
jgi:ATP-dependent RNA helicase DeaD